MPLVYSWCNRPPNFDDMQSLNILYSMPHLQEYHISTGHMGNMPLMRSMAWCYFDQNLNNIHYMPGLSVYSNAIHYLVNP